MRSVHRTDKTLEEVKADIVARIGTRHPFLDADPSIVHEVLERLTSLERDQWAEEWSRVAERFRLEGEAAAADGEISRAKEAYFRAYKLFTLARYPAPVTRKKQEAYRRAVDCYLGAAKFFDPPLERVVIPFEGKSIIGYLRLPSGAGPHPLVMHWGGIDMWKEDTGQGTEAFLRRGIGSFTMDIPGTGECPLLASPTAESVFSAALDHILTRPEVDPARITVQGGSFGAYWAAKLGIVERARLRAAVFWGGPVHYGFQPKWLRKALKTKSYLFDFREARFSLFGVKSLNAYLATSQQMSLKTLGLVDLPSVPMLLINGKRDELQPFEDVYVLLDGGNPKTARLYPEGGHMGRSLAGPSPDIQGLIADWIAANLAIPRRSEFG
ncbi:MAG TPA: alpha/beta hydrolase [Candidatus Binatia bacterium]|nr:alpha/beta hydrolase [Candidatus Binatia bacterium]